MSEHKTFFKDPPLSRKVKRGLQRQERATKEDSEKDKVRKADSYCRFPSCGCRKFRLALHVAHLEHKGMGGNPAGDRSEQALMILLCSARHRENIIALDRGTLRIRPLTAAGTRGPCAFDIAWDAIPKVADVVVSKRELLDGRWFELARERGGPHSFEVSTPRQGAILAKLREMTT